MSNIKSTDCSGCAYHKKYTCNNMDKRLTVIRTADKKEPVVLCDGRKAK